LERAMKRPLLSLGFSCCVLAALSAHGAVAEDLPVRKAGLWEMKVVKTGASSIPDVTMQHCTDETIDRDMTNSAAPVAKDNCSKQDIHKTSTGYVGDSVCAFGGTSIAMHTEVVGDLNSAYTVLINSHSDKGPSGKPIDTTTKIEAKWLGACKPDQKPGDIVMPGGFKINVKGVDKLKGLLKSN
jgi:Protein of unknown function (DUF3617)